MRMNPEFEKQLAAKVQQELNTLGELSAPPALAGRVLRAIEQRSAAPWYRCAWQTWPLAMQGVSLVALVLLFGGICFGVGELSHAARSFPRRPASGRVVRLVGRAVENGGSFGRRGGDGLPPSGNGNFDRLRAGAARGLRGVRGPRHGVCAPCAGTSINRLIGENYEKEHVETNRVGRAAGGRLRRVRAFDRVGSG